MDPLPGDEPPPLISVLVINYNSGAYLQGCLASLARQTFRDFEVIVLDNASQDDSLTLVGPMPPGLRVLRETSNHGFARGNNLAAAAARGKWLALLNPDAEAEPDWLERLLEAVRRRPDFRIVASLQTDLHDPARLDGAGDCYLAYGFAWRGGFGHRADAAPAAGSCFAACGAAMFLPRALFLAAGGFDERYFCYHEDVDLGFRLRLMGEQCQFDPACRIRHAGSGVAGRYSAFSVFHGARNAIWTYAKNMPAPLLVVTAPVLVVGMSAWLVRNALAGRGGPTLRGLAAAIRGLGGALRSRRALRPIRQTGSLGIARAITWNPLHFLGRRALVKPFGADALDAARRSTE